MQLLTSERMSNAEEVQKEFVSFSELLKYENDEMAFSDQAKTIVQNYANIPDQINSTLNQAKDQFK